MNPAEVMDVLEHHGALLRGHFQLSSGKHSDQFVQKFRAFEQPRLAQAFGEAIAQRFKGEFDLVASPAVGAVVLGFTTALAGDSRVIFAERVEDVLTFRRGFEVVPHERVLIVEDVITTGGSAREVVDLVRKSGGRPVGVGCLLDRSDRTRPPNFGVRLEAVARLDAAAWDATDCPLCASDAPLTDLGSRRVSRGPGGG